MAEQSVLLAGSSRDEAVRVLGALAAVRPDLTPDVTQDCDLAVDWLCARGLHEGRGAATLPRLVLLDVRMNRREGLDALARLRAHPRSRAVPVVILTGARAERDIADASHRGANGYVVMPAEPRALTAALAEVCRMWMETPAPARPTASDASRSPSPSTA